jgi:hypothetical protein
MRRHENVFVDSQILNLLADRSDPDMNVLADSDDIQLLMPHSVQAEVDRASTPPHVRRAAAEILRSLHVGLTASERADMNTFVASLVGAKKPENIVPDLVHAWEAAKYGRFLITLDHDLLSRAQEITNWNGLLIVKPAEARRLHDAMVVAAGPLS